MTHRFAKVAILAVCLAAPISSRAGMLDQHNDDPSAISTTLFINSGQDLAQTFTVGRTGLLDQFDLQLVADGTADLLVDIRRTTVTGVPSLDPASILISFSEPAALLPQFSPDWVSFVLGSHAIPVTSGEVLAITLRSSDTVGNDPGFEWAASDSHTYAGGHLFARTPPTGPFIATVYNSEFRTYVQAVPEPSSLALAATGGIVLIGSAWRRRGAIA